MKKISIIISSIILIALFLQSCKKDDDPGTAPTLPPESTFAINFDEFGTANDTLNKSAGLYQNWGVSFVNVAVWNTIITLYGVVPVASYAEAFNHQAEYDKDLKKWVWEYSVSVPSGTYTCKLHGDVSGDEVTWEMYISKQFGVQDFKWYEGKSKLDGSSGSWTLYESMIKQTKLIDIVWNRDVDAGTADIKYTNAVPGGAENGGYIMYGVTADSDYDRFYDIYNKGKDNLTSIKWNSIDKNGQVYDSIYFGDTDNHCWNSNLRNEICN